MSRTKRDFPVRYKGEDWASKYGRDGQYSPGLSIGWQHGRFACKCWLCCVGRTPSTKRAVVKLRRAYEKNEARAKVHECLTQLVRRSVV